MITATPELLPSFWEVNIPSSDMKHLVCEFPMAAVINDDSPSGLKIIQSYSQR